MLGPLCIRGIVQEQLWFQQGCFLILWVLCSCPFWVPFRGRTEGLFEDNADAGPVRGGGITGTSDLVVGGPEVVAMGL